MRRFASMLSIALERSLGACVCLNGSIAAVWYADVHQNGRWEAWRRWIGNMCAAHGHGNNLTSVKRAKPECETLARRGHCSPGAPTGSRHEEDASLGWVNSGGARVVRSQREDPAGARGDSESSGVAAKHEEVLQSVRNSLPFLWKPSPVVNRQVNSMRDCSALSPQGVKVR